MAIQTPRSASHSRKGGREREKKRERGKVGEREKKNVSSEGKVAYRHREVIRKGEEKKNGRKREGIDPQTCNPCNPLLSTENAECLLCDVIHEIT